MILPCSSLPYCVSCELCCIDTFCSYLNYIPCAYVLCSCAMDVKNVDPPPYVFMVEDGEQ